MYWALDYFSEGLRFFGEAFMPELEEPVYRRNLILPKNTPLEALGGDMLFVGAHLRKASSEKSEEMQLSLNL